jgi:hypothetical protein
VPKLYTIFFLLCILCPPLHEVSSNIPYVIRAFILCIYEEKNARRNNSKSSGRVPNSFCACLKETYVDQTFFSPVEYK